MRRPPWENEAEEALDQPVTVTGRQLRTLKRRGAAAILGAVLAAAGLVFVAFGMVRVETALRQGTKDVALLRASLPDSVRAQVAAHFDRATREEIRRVAQEGAEQTLGGTRGEVGRLASRVRALSDSLESALAVLDAETTRIAALTAGQDSLGVRLGLGEARIAALDSAGATRSLAIQSSVSELGRRMQTVEAVQSEQDEQLRSAKKKESILLGAVPIFLGPYIHILGHAGR